MQCCVHDAQSSSDPAALGLPFLFFLGFFGLLLAAALACSASRRNRSCSCSCRLTQLCNSVQALLCDQNSSSHTCCLFAASQCTYALFVLNMAEDITRLPALAAAEASASQVQAVIKSAVRSREPPAMLELLCRVGVTS